MNYPKKRIFITGIAGFIGFHLAKFLQKRDDFVIGCDDFNDYYDPSLKRKRASLLKDQNISIIECEIHSKDLIENLIIQHKITHFVHLAAQAGIRYSLQNPAAYMETNLNGFFYILEVLKNHPHIPLVFASSSSVYGLNEKIPFSEFDNTDLPANFYGATKKANELMAHSYHYLHEIRVTGLRYFTVYGPWGRPDMAYSIFTKNILEGKTIRLFNHGDMKRDFTYIDDIIKGTAAAIDLGATYEIINLGNHRPEKIGSLISIIESFLNKKAKIEKIPMQPGEIPITYADTTKAEKLLGFSPKTSLKKGMHKFLAWFTNSLVDK